MDENEYLQPDFDPATYKIPQLRNVLLQNDVSYPNGAKKKDLIELFNQHVKPHSEQRLKELQGVIANDDGIEYVEKKKSKKSKDVDVHDADDDSKIQVEKIRKKPSKKAKDESEEPAVRKSPRKTSKSSRLKEDEENEDDLQIIEEPKTSPRKSRTAARNISADLGKIPDLKKSPPRVREKSPRRKASAKAKSAPEEIEESKPRERSPRRKVSDQKEPKTASTRERSPAKKVKEVKEEVKETKPKKRETRKKSKTKEEPKQEEDDDVSDDELQQVTQQEFEQVSPYKFGSKFESSFSKDNVFQSPGHSSPDIHPKKTIPRKRASETTSKSPRKSTKTIRKTAFSSSPEPSQAVKSPGKKALEISKFETSSPPSNFVKNEIANNDIFAVDESPKQHFTFDNVTEKAPSSSVKPIINENENFETPNDGNASKISNLSSAASTPSKSGIKRKSLIPDFSKFKVSREFAKTLGITVQGEPEEQKEEQKGESAQPEDPELIDIAGDDDDDDDDSDSDEEAEQSVNDDSVLRNLQEEIDSANSAVQKEAAEAIKQVNDVFQEEKQEDEEIETNSEGPQPKSKSRSLVNFSAFFGFFKQLFVFFFFVFVVIFALWYREQRILIGYCGLEINQPTFPNAQNEYLIRFDEFLQTLKPQCLEAPENAITLPKLKIKCRPDYVVYEPWYKVHGFFPFSDYCVKDEEKENIIKEVVSKSLELLRTKNANTKCGDGDDFEVGVSDEELYEFFFESKASTISDEEFDELWSRVLVDLKSEPEITVRHVCLHLSAKTLNLLTFQKLRYTRANDTGSTQDNLSTDEDEEETYIPKEQTIFRSNSKVKLSIKCKFKKEIYENFERNKKVLIGSSLVLMTVLISYRKFVSYQKRQSKIKEISDIIIIKLQKQQKNAINDSTGLTNRYISNIQLRDELLSNLKNSEKYEIWESILNKLEKNSNVRGSTREIHGDIVKVYEWIGE